MSELSLSGWGWFQNCGQQKGCLIKQPNKSEVFWEAVHGPLWSHAMKTSPFLKQDKTEDLNLWAEAVEEPSSYLTRKAVTDGCDRTQRGTRRNLHQQMSPCLIQCGAEGRQVLTRSSALSASWTSSVRGTMDLWISVCPDRLTSYNCVPLASDIC